MQPSFDIDYINEDEEQFDKKIDTVVQRIASKLNINPDELSVVNRCRTVADNQ